MIDRLRQRMLRWLRVPPEPSPPAGRADSIRVFRAGRKFYGLRLLRWGVGQVAALIGLIFGLAFLHTAESSASAHRDRQAAGTNDAIVNLPITNAPPDEGRRPGRRERRSREPLAERFGRAAATVPAEAFPVLRVIEWLGVLGFLGQLVVSLALVRFDYELRWYVVTDRSLRIREGLWEVQEMTMSFANIQQVVVSQGPLERLLGLADVRVQSAGGGGEGHSANDRKQDSMHTGIFRGVEHASEIRDLILERLRLFRESGLGDPDEARLVVAAAEGGVAPTVGGEAVLAAARELLDEARALRLAASARSS